MCSHASAESTLCIDLSADEATVHEQVREIARIAHPEWRSQTLIVSRFNDGYSNALYACCPDSNAAHERDEEAKVCVRVNGVLNKLKDQQEELRDLEALAKCGLAAPTYVKFSNGLCYGYQVGHACSDDNLRDVVVSDLIARRLAQLHTVQMSHATHGDRTNGKGDGDGESETFLVRTLRKMLSLLPDVESFRDAQKQELMRQVFPQKEALHKEVEEVLQKLQSLHHEVAFCHNDLLAANIILHNDAVHFIDYEFSGMNFVAYDIANHFTEFAGILPCPDYTLYPNREFQLRFLRTYLREKHHLQKFNGSTAATEGLHRPKAATEKVEDDAELEKLYVSVQHFSVATHLFWSLWSLLLAHAQQESELNILGYSASRFDQYRQVKDERLALSFQG